MKIYNENLRFLLEWYKTNGYRPIPQVSPGHPDEEVFALYFTDNIGEISHDRICNGYLEELQISGRDLPLVAACISGIASEHLAEIARHHSVNALSLILTFSTTDKPLLDVNGAIVETFPIFLACLKAIETNGLDKVLQGYREGVETSPFTLALIHMDSAAVWPSTLLREYQNALTCTDKIPPATYFMTRMHNFMSWVRDEHHLPHDETGVRYDWFLERSGMLLPVVTRKALGSFTLWEDFLEMAALMPENKAIQGLMNYCIQGAPESMRPAIYNGFRSMKLDCLEGEGDADPWIVFMQKHFTGTWLEPLTFDPMLKLNLIGKHRAFKAHITDHPELFAELLQLPGEHLNNLFSSLAALPAEDIGYEVFSTLPYFTQQAATLDPAFGREAFIAHILSGLDSFLGDEPRVDFEDKANIHDYSIDTCMRLIKEFTASKSIDYSQFKGLSSRSILLLKQAGLDIKQLPAMSNRDRGRALEMEIGL